MSKILLVEDDLGFAKNIIASLTVSGTTVDHAESAEAAQAFLETYGYDLAILDWELPGQSGPDLCSTLKSKYPQIPVIMLTGKTGLDNTVTGLGAGADDYVPKPCSLSELEARIRSLLRRDFAAQEAKSISCGQISVIERQHQAIVCGEPLELSGRELELLTFFVKNPDRIFTSQALFLRIWQDKPEISLDLVRVYIKRLRDKLIEITGESPIQTHGRSGFSLPSATCGALRIRTSSTNIADTPESG